MAALMPNVRRARFIYGFFNSYGSFAIFAAIRLVFAEQLGR
jgi:hypothetical protein